jgi:predicted thioesterase
MDALQPGLVGEAHTTVTSSNVASAFGSGHVDVFATPAMIALMENAAINAVGQMLAEGSATVGSAISIRHVAATPVGLEVRARAELLEVDGRRLTFRVEAFDPVEKIGDGSHERYVVNLDRLLGRAAAKAGTGAA